MEVVTFNFQKIKFYVVTFNVVTAINLLLKKKSHLTLHRGIIVTSLVIGVGVPYELYHHYHYKIELIA